jgi:hypothetical protein
LLLEVLPGVNFIKVLRACFWYKILAPKTMKLAFGFEIFVPKISYKKGAQKAVMKLTPIGKIIQLVT